MAGPERLLGGFTEKTADVNGVKIKASGEFRILQGRLVATDVRGRVIKGSGHWLMEEAPQQVIPALIGFLNEHTRG